MPKFTSVRLSSSFYARPSRSCLLPLLQPPIKELTTMTEQALQPPQTPELTPSYQCLSCAGCRTTAAASPVLRRKKKIRSLGIDQGAFCLLAGMLNTPATRTLTTLSSLMLLCLGSPLPIVLLEGTLSASTASLGKSHSSTVHPWTLSGCSCTSIRCITKTVTNSQTLGWWGLDQPHLAHWLCVSLQYIVTVD